MFIFVCIYICRYIYIHFFLKKKNFKKNNYHRKEEVRTLVWKVGLYLENACVFQIDLSFDNRSRTCLKNAALESSTLTV